jgi:hypothetical protein
MSIGSSAGRLLVPVAVALVFALSRRAEVKALKKAGIEADMTMQGTCFHAFIQKSNS